MAPRSQLYSFIWKMFSASEKGEFYLKRRNLYFRKARFTLATTWAPKIQTVFARMYWIMESIERTYCQYCFMSSLPRCTMTHPLSSLPPFQIFPATRPRFQIFCVHTGTGACSLACPSMQCAHDHVFKFSARIPACTTHATSVSHFLRSSRHVLRTRSMMTAVT